MFGGINFKQLSERFNESLHDLESTLAQAATATGPGSQQNTPTRQQPTRSSTSPAAGAASASPSRSRPRPVIDPQARSQSASSSSSTPLSPTSLAQASQSASQLADSALSSLRASLRKGRQSLESAAAARTSLDKSAPGASTAAATSPAASGKPTPLKEEPATTAGDPPTVDKTADSSATSSAPADGAQKAEFTAASESNDVKSAPTVMNPPQEPTSETTVASTVEATTVEEKTAEEDLLGLLADDPAPAAGVAEAGKVEPVSTTTTSVGVSSSVEPSAAIASPPTNPVSPEQDAVPVPYLAVCPPAPASHTSPISPLSPMAYEATGEEDDADDADDWGMGSISPAPDSEGFVDPPVQTAAATATPVAVEPSKAAESPESAAHSPTAVLPNEEAPASVEVQEEKEEEEASDEPSLESSAPSQPTDELDESSVDKSVDATTRSIDEAAKGSEATSEEVAAPPSREETDSEPSPAVADATETPASATERLASVGDEGAEDAAAGADEEQAAPEAKVAGPSDSARTDPTAETVELPDAIKTSDVAGPESNPETAVQPLVLDEAAHAAAPASEALVKTPLELAEASPADLEDEINPPEKVETEQPSDEPAPSEPVPPAVAALVASEKVKVDVPATTEIAELSAEEDPIVPLRPAEEAVATSPISVRPADAPVEEPVAMLPILTPEADKLSTEQAVADLEPAPDPSPESDVVSELPNQMVPQADELAEEKAAETTEEKVQTPVTERVDEKVDEKADEKAGEKAVEKVAEKEGERVNEKAEVEMRAKSIPEEQTAPEVVVSSAPRPVDAQQGEGEVLPAEPPKRPTGKADKPKSAIPATPANGEIHSSLLQAGRVTDMPKISIDSCRVVVRVQLCVGSDTCGRDPAHRCR